MGMGEASAARGMTRTSFAEPGLTIRLLGCSDLRMRNCIMFKSRVAGCGDALAPLRAPARQADTLWHRFLHRCFLKLSAGGSEMDDTYSDSNAAWLQR
jgi:hypothetical protein